MANVYVRSAAAGAGTGADWTNAYTTLGAAFSAKAAGDVFWVSEDHAESTAASTTLSCPGTATAPCFVYCVNHAGSVPPVSADLRTTATVTVTGNSFFKIADAYVSFDGIQFVHSPGANPQSFTIGSGGSCLNILIKNGAVNELSTNNSSVIFGQTNSNRGGRIVLDNTTMTFGATNDYLTFSGVDFVWRNTASAIGGATFPTTLVDTSAASESVSTVLFTGLDLSALAGTLFGPSLTSTKFVIEDCKINASATIAAAGTIVAGFESVAIVDAVRVDSAGTNYVHQRVRYAGSHVQETTIVRTGGASDGTTGLSWKIIATANSRWLFPFEAMPITIWNDSTSAITTLTIYGTTTGGGVPNNDDIWVEVEYLGSGSSPKGSFITSTKADNLAASASTNNSTDASTWGGGGAGNGFKIVVPSFTPGQKGPINITVKVAKASATYYIDPRPSISGVTVAKSEILGPGVYANELSSGGGASAVQYRANMSGNV